MVANDLNAAALSVRYSPLVSTLRIRPWLSMAYCPSTIPATPEPLCARPHRTWAATISNNIPLPVATQIGSHRGDPLEKTVDIFNERYARAGVRTKSTTHPRNSRRNQGKIESTSVPAKLPMYANTLATKPHADKTAGNVGLPNLIVTVSVALQINLECASVFGRIVNQVTDRIIEDSRPATRAL
jgi:hypothetical protein